MSRPQIQTLLISGWKTNDFNFNFTVSIISLKLLVHLTFKKNLNVTIFILKQNSLQMMAELDTGL